MRWQETIYVEGDRRERRGFLFTPKCDSGMEWRWLERARWSEEYGYTRAGCGCWSTQEWIDE